MEFSELGKAIRLNELAKIMNVHLTSLYRWINTGVRGKRLRTVMIGGRRAVLPRDLETFLLREFEEDDSPEPGTNVAHKDAVKKLHNAGLLSIRKTEEQA